MGSEQCRVLADRPRREIPDVIGGEEVERLIVDMRVDDAVESTGRRCHATAAEEVCARADERSELGWIAVGGMQIGGLGRERVELGGGGAGRIDHARDEQTRATFVGGGIGAAGQA